MVDWLTHWAKVCPALSYHDAFYRRATTGAGLPRPPIDGQGGLVRACSAVGPAVLVVTQACAAIL